MSSIVIARGVSYEFPNGRRLLDQLNFSLKVKQLAALVGPNGVGKTCLARLLTGEFEPTQGEIRRNAPIRLLPQREEPASVTVAEYLSPDYEWSLPGERLLTGIDRDALCSTLSGGQWMRVRLARALSDEYLILDEPTNDLDRAGRRDVLQFLRDRSGGALLISHDRECLQLCEEIYELSNRGLMKFGGSWSDYSDAKQRERERLAAALDVAKRQRDSILADHTEKKARQEKRNRRGAQAAARGGMPRILIGARKRRAQVTSGKLDVQAFEQAQKVVQQVRTALDEVKVDPVMYADVIGCEIPAQKLVAEARNFNVSFRDWIYTEDLSFSWRGNVRIALRGGNGSGKSTLLKALLGEQFDTRGELRLGSLTSLYLDQRCRLPDEHGTVFDNVRAVTDVSDTEVRNGLARFLFAGDAAFRKVQDLSGGERLRAALARGFLSAQRPQLLVLDEPTNNLDLSNVEFLEGIVREFRGALIAVSHDAEFLRNCGVSEELVVRSS